MSDMLKANAEVGTMGDERKAKSGSVFQFIVHRSDF
jgi:hypothetical protein